jgi:hypothetical protein
MSTKVRGTTHLVIGSALLCLGSFAFAQVSPGKQSHVHTKADKVCVSKDVSVSGGESDLEVSEQEVQCSKRLQTLSQEELSELSRQVGLQ